MERAWAAGQCYQGAQGNVWGDERVHYFDRGDGFTDVHTCQNLSNCTLNKSVKNNS